MAKQQKQGQPPPWRVSQNISKPPSLQSHLAKIDKARLLLMEARTLPEIKKVKDIAEAAKEYARAQNLSRECQNHAALIALDAAEKGGRLLLSCEKSEGGRPLSKTAATVAGDSEYRTTVDAAGLSERTARRWQELASVPAEIKTEYIQKTLGTGEVTASGLMKAYEQTLPTPAKSERALSREEAAKKLQDENLFPEYDVRITPAVLASGGAVGFNVQFMRLTEAGVRELATGECLCQYKK